jgi:hypothetical protein
MVKKIKISPIMPMIKQWLQNFKMSGPITCTSLVTRIASKIDALEDQNVVYISTPRLIIDEDYLVQGHTFKHDAFGNIVFFFPGYTNEFSLPNPELHLYNCRELTFTLVSQEEAHGSNVSGRMTRSRTRNEASSSQHQPPHSPVVMQQTYHAGWIPTRQALGYTPRFQPGWDQPPQPHEAGGSGWQSVDSTEWA